jgi:Tfp pilus assembly protein PilF
MIVRIPALGLLLLLAACAGSSAKQLHENARETARRGYSERALKLYREALDKDPEDVVIHRDYQNLMRKLHRLEIVRTEYRRKLAVDPQSARILYLVGRLEKDEAIESYMKRSLAADPEFFWAHYGLATYYKNRSRYVDALRHFEWILAKYKLKDLPEIVIANIAIVYSRTGKMADAKRLLSAATAKFPESPLAPFYLGLILLGDKNDSEGIRQLRLALSRDKNFYKAYAPLVQVYHRRSDYASAKVLRRKAAELYNAYSIPELGNEFVIQIERIKGWVLTVTEKLSPGVDHPLEKGAWRYVADLLPEDPSKNVRIRYVLRQTGDFEHVTMRSVTDRAGKTHRIPVKDFRLTSGDDYRAFYSFLMKDAPAILDQYGR